MLYSEKHRNSTAGPLVLRGDSSSNSGPSPSTASSFPFLFWLAIRGEVSVVGCFVAAVPHARAESKQRPVPTSAVAVCQAVHCRSQIGGLLGSGNAWRAAPCIFRLAQKPCFWGPIWSLRNVPPRTAPRPKFLLVPLATRGAASGRCNFWPGTALRPTSSLRSLRSLQYSI